MNIADPAHPFQAARLTLNANLFDLAIEENYLYVAAGLRGLLIIDVSNVPYVAGTYRPTLDADVDAEGVCVIDHLVYATFEFGGLYLINASSPQLPTLLGKYHGEDNFTSVVVKGNHAYLTSDYKKEF
ncbi:MAG: hypothetical protein ACM3SY_14440 [Candidatus Omnitrophota bacterium]